jgi:hypothetical protein
METGAYYLQPSLFPRMCSPLDYPSLHYCPKIGIASYKDRGLFWLMDLEVPVQNQGAPHLQACRVGSTSW